eukprot:COSAG04_NODE_28600_length_274_cov_1.177143_1_plen_51_part_01
MGRRGCRTVVDRVGEDLRQHHHLVALRLANPVQRARAEPPRAGVVPVIAVL